MFVTARTLRTTLLTGALVGAALVAVGAANASGGTAVDAITAASPSIGRAVEPDEALIEPVRARTRALPADPMSTLVAATAALATEVGRPRDPGPAIRSAGLSAELAGRTANLVNDILVCTRLTQNHYAGIPTAALSAALRTGAGVDAAVRTRVRACARSAWTATVELQLAIEAELPTPAAGGCAALGTVDLDLWPVLRFDGRCADSTYRHDYLVTIDVGGNDTYRNNAGGNLVDLNFAPAGAGVPGVRGTAPAKGCQRAIPGLAAADCVPLAAVVLDLAGRDTYGTKEAPEHDAGCTRDPVVRRMMTGGAGFLGVGILRDAGNSADSYVGKTGSLGAGHLFGVGILSDNGGDDRYQAVRNSQGFALVGGFGLLRDEAGADAYGYYLPAPINPAAPNQAEGAGGVRDDEGEGRCDRIPRFVQGAANVLPGTVGLLIDDAGDDAYQGAFAGDFTAPLQTPSTRAGSLGFGNNQGVAVLLDRGAGRDSYRADGAPEVAGQPRRADDTTIAPGTDATGAGAGSGLFLDQ